LTTFSRVLILLQKLVLLIDYQNVHNKHIYKNILSILLE